MSFGEFYAGFSGLGGNIIAEMERAEQKRALAKLGAQASSGDYRGAAGTAFDAGDLSGGLGLLKLGEAAEQRRLTAAADADFLRGPPGGGFGVGGVTGASDGTRLPTIGTGGPIQPFKTNDPVAEDLPAHQRALLNGIAGPESAGKYNVRFTPRGGALFEGFDRHPGIAEMGPAGPSTAAGRYQFTRSTWDAMGGGDFSPANQDRRAVQLAQQDYRTRTGRDLDADLQAEGFSPRIQKVLAPTWVGLGGNQQRNAATYAESLARYGAAGGQQPTRVASADPGFAPQGGGLQSLPPGATGLNPGRPVQFADDENQTQVLESRLGMYPPNVYGVAQPPQRVASADPGFAPQTPTAPGPLSRPMGALPQGLSGAGDGRGGLPAPGGVPPSSASGAAAPAAVAAPRPVQAMPLSGDAPVQVAQAGGAPQIPPDARIGAVPVAVLNQQPLGTRIPWLMRAVGNPNLSEGNRDIAKMLFKDALAETKAPDGVKEFMWARANGMTRAANPGEYAREKLRDPGADLDAQIQARAAAAQRYGMQPGTPEFQNYVLGARPDRDPGRDLQAQIRTREAEGVRLGMEPGSAELQNYALGNQPATERQTEAEKITAAIKARREAAPSLGLEEGSPSWRSYVATGKVGADRDMSAADKKLIEAADTQVLSSQSTIDALGQAKELSKRAYAGPWAGKLAMITGTFGDEKGQATQELDTLLTTNALGQLKAIFGGAPTEGERKILLEIQGSSSKPDAVRQKIYDRAIGLAQLRLQQNQAKADALREGRYFRQGGGPAGRGDPGGGDDPGGQRAPAGGSPGARPGMMSAGDRFGQLVGSGMTKQQAFERLTSEGY